MVLGVNKRLEVNENNTVDIDDFLSGIVYINGIRSGICPVDRSAAYGSILLSVPRVDGLRVSQFMFHRYGVYYRLRSDSSWSEWITVH